MNFFFFVNDNSGCGKRRVKKEKETRTLQQREEYDFLKCQDHRSTVGSADWVFDTVLTSHLIGDSLSKALTCED